MSQLRSNNSLALKGASIFLSTSTQRSCDRMKFAQKTTKLSLSPDSGEHRMTEYSAEFFLKNPKTAWFQTVPNI